MNTEGTLMGDVILSISDNLLHVNTKINNYISATTDGRSRYLAQH